MRILGQAMAGTLESNDVLVKVEPGGGGIHIRVESIVLNQFGADIERAARECAQELGVRDAAIHLNDKGAIECVVKARVETALRRAQGVEA